MNRVGSRRRFITPLMAVLLPIVNGCSSSTVPTASIGATRTDPSILKYISLDLSSSEHDVMYDLLTLLDEKSRNAVIYFDGNQLHANRPSLLQKARYFSPTSIPGFYSAGDGENITLPDFTTEADSARTCPTQIPVAGPVWHTKFVFSIPDLSNENPARELSGAEDQFVLKDVGIVCRLGSRHFINGSLSRKGEFLEAQDSSYSFGLQQ